MNESIKIQIKRGLKNKEFREKLERFLFIFTGAVLILSVYDKMPSLLIGTDAVQALHTSVTFVVGMGNVFYGILNRRVKSENVKDTIVRLLFGSAGVLLLTEAYIKYTFTSSKTFIPLFTAAILYLAAAIFYEKLTVLRILKLDNRGISWRTNPLSKKSFLWQEVSSIYLEESRIRISVSSSKTYTLHFAKFMSDEDHDRFISAIQKYTNLGNSDLIVSQIYEN